MMYNFTGILDLSQLQLILSLFCGTEQWILDIGRFLILTCVLVGDLIENSIGSFILLTMIIELPTILILNSKIPEKILKYAPIAAAAGIGVTAATNLYTSSNRAHSQAAQVATQQSQAAAQAAQAAAQAAQAAAQAAQSAQVAAQAAAQAAQAASQSSSSSGEGSGSNSSSKV